MKNNKVFKDVYEKVLLLVHREVRKIDWKVNIDKRDKKEKEERDKRGNKIIDKVRDKIRDKIRGDVKDEE